MNTGLAQVSSPIILVPAYGRRYKDVSEMREDWNDGEDFGFSYSGPYTSVRDIEALKEDSSSVWLVTHDLALRVG